MNSKIDMRMGTMKRILVFLCIIACFLFGFSLIAHAHSGGTDSAGGHYNHSTGEYHYHHGHPAHQHPDGVCPYGDYGKSSSTEIETSSKSKDTALNNVLEVVFLAGFSLLLGWASSFVACVFYSQIRKINFDERMGYSLIPFFPFNILAVVFAVIIFCILY